MSSSDYADAEKVKQALLREEPLWLSLLHANALKVIELSERVEVHFDERAPGVFSNRQDIEFLTLHSSKPTFKPDERRIPYGTFLSKDAKLPATVDWMKLDSYPFTAGQKLYFAPGMLKFSIDVESHRILNMMKKAAA